MKTGSSKGDAMAISGVAEKVFQYLVQLKDSNKIK
jgi:hypothetical protein